MSLLEFNKRSIQDTLVLIGLTITFFVVLPFAVYRFINNDLFLGLLDSIILSGILGLFLSVWYSIKIKYINLIVACFYLSAVVVLVYLKTTQMIFWAYPAIIATYFLLNSSLAGLINCLFIGTIISISILKDPSYLGFYPSLLLVGIFGFILSFRSEKQNQKMELMISEDKLTKLKNRRCFDEKLAEVLALNKRSFGPVCLFLLDLDEFETLIKNHGPKKADDFLVDFSQNVKSMIRATDYIYRLSDHRFAIITTNVDLERSGILTKNIKDSVIKKDSFKKYDLSVSIGIAQIHTHDDVNSCFSRANLALHEAKNNGRNEAYVALQNQYGDIKFSRADEVENKRSKSSIVIDQDDLDENFKIEEVLI